MIKFVSLLLLLFAVVGIYLTVVCGALFILGEAIAPNLGYLFAVSCLVVQIYYLFIRPIKINGTSDGDTFDDNYLGGDFFGDD
jgi:hypothetical protein